MGSLSRAAERASREPERPACPFCESADVERIGQWGGQMITAQWRCRACGSYYEAIREDFAAPGASGPGERE